MRISPRAIDVAIVGAGQAGLSLSHCLTQRGIEHVILERGRVAESWRSERWDSFTLVTPNWSIRLAGRPYGGADPHGFMGRNELVSLLQNYAWSFSAPVETAVEVKSLRMRSDGRFQLHGAQGDIRIARVAVVATATHRHPRIPRFAARISNSVMQVHASQYRNPQALPAGSVLVVGSAQSGCQLADELNRAGRRVFLATGSTGRLPRRYRDRDIIAWQRDMGFLDRSFDALQSPQMRFRPDPHLTGHGGGRTLDLRVLAEQGVTLTGRVQDACGEELFLAHDLQANLMSADEFAARVLHDVDEHIRVRMLDAPTANETNSDLGYHGVRTRMSSPPTLNLREQGIGAIVWATGFRHDFSWVRAPVLDAFGYPIQRAGKTNVAGLHFLGLNYVDRRASGILYGAEQDALQLANLIAEELSTSAQRY